MEWLTKIFGRLMFYCLGLTVFLVVLALLWREGRPDGQAVMVEPSAYETPEKPLWGFFYPAWKNPGLHKLAPLIDDPFKRTDASFEISAGIRPRVLFWMAIYGVFESRHKVVHDRDRPDLIYGHIDLSSLSEHLWGAQFGHTSERIEGSVRNKLAGWINMMAKGIPMEPAMVGRTGELRQFLQSRGYTTPEQWTTLAKNLRTQSGQQDAFIKALARSQDLLPEIESTFKKHGLPKHAARIPFVESSFHPAAVSKVGAIGIWQFTPSTAKEWISKDKNKWKDINEQTVAAARMLANYHRHLPDWGTTVTAYNSGVTRLMRLVQANKAKHLDEILANDDSPNGLGFAGENFYSEVLAATLVEAYKTEIFTGDLLDGALALKASDDNPFVGYCVAEEPKERAPDSNSNAAGSPVQGEIIMNWLSDRWAALTDRLTFFKNN